MCVCVKERERGGGENIPLVFKEINKFKQDKIEFSPWHVNVDQIKYSRTNIIFVFQKDN